MGKLEIEHLALERPDKFPLGLKGGDNLSDGLRQLIRGRDLAIALGEPLLAGHKLGHRSFEKIEAFGYRANGFPGRTTPEKKAVERVFDHLLCAVLEVHV